jgi:hypothetical protein
LIQRLRRQGEIVVRRLPDEVGTAEPGDFIFDRELRLSDAGWQLTARDIATSAK